MAFGVSYGARSQRKRCSGVFATLPWTEYTNWYADSLTCTKPALFNLNVLLMALPTSAMTATTETFMRPWKERVVDVEREGGGRG